MNWPDWINDLHDWKHSSALFRGCFWLSLLFGVMVSLQKMAVPAALWLHLKPWNGAHFAAASVEVISLIAATLLWAGMLTDCMAATRSVWAKALWGLFFFIGIWGAADFYYLLIYEGSSGGSS